MGFTVEEINMLLELLAVEQGKQAAKIMKVSLKNTRHQIKITCVDQKFLKVEMPVSKDEKVGEII